MWSSKGLLSPALVSCGSDIPLGFWSLLPYLGEFLLSLPCPWLACHFCRKELRVESSFFFFLLSALLYKRLILSASGLRLGPPRLSFGRCGGKVRLFHPSYWCEVEVVIDLHKWDVKLGDLKDTGGLVCGRVQLLKFELPLQTLHCIESCCLVLLPHQKTRLWREQKFIIV